MFLRISANFFVETDRLILKFTHNYMGPRIDKTILKKRNKVGRLILPDFKTYYKAMVLVWYLQKDKQIDE